MLKEKEVWDVVDKSWADPIIASQIRKKVKNNTITSKIIKQGVNDNLYINIIRERNCQKSWETLCQVYLQVGQGVVYSILKILLNYPRVTKPLGYNKKANIIFAKVKQLVQTLQSIVTKQKTIWESITLVITLDSLHDDFEMTSIPLFYSSYKDLEKF